MKKYFYIVVSFKILLLAIFSSGYKDELFTPFLIHFIENNDNPWQYFYESKLNLDSFPYHTLMLYILTPFVALINLLELDNILMTNLIFKLPLFISDLFIYGALINLFPTKRKKVFLFYFCSPIIIYAIYIHSQLDIIPMALLFLGILELTNNRLKISAILIGAALATKFHVLVAIPLLFFFLLKKHSLREIITFFSICFGVLIILDLPYIFSEGFSKMVLFNPKQSMLFDSFIEIGQLKLLLPIASIIIIYFHFFNQKRINRDLLLFYFGLLFTGTIIFIYPVPAWYVWLVPFISIYFINNKEKTKALLFYSVFSIVYLLFFVFFYHPDYKDIIFLGNEVNFKIDNVKLINITFTLLLSMLLIIINAFYKYGIKSNSIYKKQSNLTIGIGGDSAVGKLTLLKRISSILGSQLLIIEGDGEHKWERGHKNWSKYTHLDPKANFIHKQAEVISDLKFNNSIYRSDYNHSTGKFNSPSKIEPKKFIVIAGLHPFYLPKQRKNIDLKIFMDTSDDLRKHWKILRDVAKRGYSATNVIEQIEGRYEDGNKFIAPQKEFADLVIEYFSTDKIQIGESDYEIKLGIKIILDANIQLDEIINNLGVEFVWDYNKDLKTQFFTLKHEPKSNFNFLANKYISNIQEIIAPNAIWLKGYNGLLQFICLLMISEKLKEL